ncbi:MAG: hypothetical protein WCR06_07150 [bacterium]
MKTDQPFKVLPWLRELRDQHAEVRQRMNPQEKDVEDRASETLVREYEERARKNREPFTHACVAETSAEYGRK